MLTSIRPSLAWMSNVCLRRRHDRSARRSVTYICACHPYMNIWCDVLGEEVFYGVGVELQSGTYEQIGTVFTDVEPLDCQDVATRFEQVGVFRNVEGLRDGCCCVFIVLCGERVPDWAAGGVSGSDFSSVQIGDESIVVADSKCKSAVPRD